MNLGEKIYHLRVKKNLSQGDIADALDVSRQSVSKWENNNAVPDLDKIIKLAELLEVSLDELVLGKEAQDTIRADEPVPEQNLKHSGKTTAGIVLLCTAVLILVLCTMIGGVGGLLLGLAVALPFAVSAIICMKVKRNAGLWCAWTFYFFTDLYLAYTTGIRWSMIRWTAMFEASMNYGRLAVAWVLFFVMLALMFFSIRCFVKSPGNVGKKYILVSGAVLLALILFGKLIGPYLVYRWSRIASILLGWGRMWAMIALITAVVKYKMKKKKIYDTIQ